MLLVANVIKQIKLLLKLIVVLLGVRAQKALVTPANYCINDFILIRFYKKYLEHWQTKNSWKSNFKYFFRSLSTSTLSI
jgi:hypothetical protein